MAYTRLNLGRAKPGSQYDISGLITAGYNTASGNYIDFCLPVINDGVTGISAASISCSIYLANGTKLENAINTSVLPTIQSMRSADHLVIELRYKTTQTANLPGTIIFNNGSSITFS